MERTMVRSLADNIGQEVYLKGWVHSRRDLGGIQFLVLRDRTGIVQCVFNKTDIPIGETCVAVTGIVVYAKKAPGGLELHAHSLNVLAPAIEPAPIEIPKEDWMANPETLLEYRHVSLRGIKARATMKVKAELVRAFREYLDSQDFTEIYSPKLVAAGAEGGANLFEVDYYGQRAYLAQSPQLYKQIMVGVYERVYETAPVYRAEQSHTSRHLSEYLSLDVEFGFIEDEGDVMDLQEALTKAMMKQLGERCQEALALMGAELPNTEVSYPRIPLLEARELIEERYGHKTGGKDLDPEAERLVSQWAKEEHDSDFCFVTHYPQEARPFYTYPTEDGLTRGVDLIFRGVEITSGGQRIHDYSMLVAELAKRKMNAEDFKGYLDIFKYGMPPHGGFAIGAERITALLLGIHNVRFARAFPRDGSRLQP